MMQKEDADHFDAEELRLAKRYLLRRLSRQNLHSSQAEQGLRDRLFRPQAIEAIITEFQQKGFLNDQDWVARYIETRKKKYGIRKILAQLRQKGISVSSEFLSEEPEKTAIVTLLKTRYATKDLKDPKQRRKVVDSLARRGYSFTEIVASLESFIIA